MRISKRVLSLALSIAGVAGVGLTSWLSVKCSKKAEGETDKKKKILAYAPAVISGVGTSACILGSHHVSRKEIAALTASCTYLAANREKIESKIKDKFGMEKLEEVKKETAAEPVLIKGQTVEETGHGDTLFLDLYLGRKFRSSLQHVEWAEKQLNYEYHQGNPVCMNDFYSYLGIEPTIAGDQFGWPTDEDSGYDPDLETPIKFENVKGEDENGELMYAIDIGYYSRPCSWWMEA